MAHSCGPILMLQSSSRAFALVALVTFVSFGGCAPFIRSSHQPPANDVMLSDRLVFGRNIPSGGVVSDSAWEVFVREIVSPRLPDGLTIWRAEGQWRDAEGRVVREPSLVLEVFHRHDTAIDLALREIAAEYKRRFRQEAVLRAATPARVNLFEE
jgi:hypothetical protein